MFKENQSLKNYNTFGIDVNARFFTEVSNEDQFRRVIQTETFKTNTNLILGGGSNLLFTKHYEGIVIKNNIKGIELVSDKSDYVLVKVGAGENWHEFVLHCITNGWFGVENLSLIPGNVGASPMQNIGAYGVEIKSVFHELEAIDLATGEIHYFDNNSCSFGYRESVFKNEKKGQFFISRVTFKLQKNATFNIGYGAVEDQLKANGIKTYTAKAVSDAIVQIRQSKLPDPKEIGNSGSFFKNPVVSRATFLKIQADYPAVVGYEVDEENVKLAAGWLIDQAGWKGKTLGNYGVHKKQALVLVNYGGATGEDIYNLSEDILQSVKAKFGVELEREVNIY